MCNKDLTFRQWRQAYLSTGVSERSVVWPLLHQVEDVAELLLVGRVCDDAAQGGVRFREAGSGNDGLRRDLLQPQNLLRVGGGNNLGEDLQDRVVDVGHQSPAGSERSKSSTENLVYGLVM